MRALGKSPETVYRAQTNGMYPWQFPAYERSPGGSMGGNVQEAAAL